MGSNQSLSTLPAKARPQSSRHTLAQIASWRQQVAALETETLQRGDRGTAVEQLQQVLQALGLYDRPADGVFGGDTEASLQQLQRQFGLSETGAFDSYTWYALTFWAKPSLEAQQRQA